MTEVRARRPGSIAPRVQQACVVKLNPRIWSRWGAMALFCHQLMDWSLANS